jgi:hypothetical protein
MIFHQKSEFSYLILMEILSIITLNPTHFIIKIYFLIFFLLLFIYQTYYCFTIMLLVFN